MGLPLPLATRAQKKKKDRVIGLHLGKYPKKNNPTQKCMQPKISKYHHAK
jgi:hypothetical protein